MLRRVPFRVLLPPVSDYSPRIRAARGYAGLTQEGLAEALGVDVQTIKRRESSNGKEPKQGERIAIAAICGVPIEFMEQGFGEIRRDDVLETLDGLRVTVDDLLEAVSVLIEQRQVEEAEPPPTELPAGRRLPIRRHRTARPGDDQGSPS